MVNEGLKVTGRYRIQLVEDVTCANCNAPWQAVDGACWNCSSTETVSTIVGECDETNQVTNLGFNLYLVSTLGAIAGSQQISHVALGTGTVPGAAATTLDGEITHASNSRQAVTAATSSSSKTLRLTATFASSDSHNTAAANISNIGLFQQSNTNTATLMAANTYTSSSWATNQSVNVTYDITFS